MSVISNVCKQRKQHKLLLVENEKLRSEINDQERKYDAAISKYIEAKTLRDDPAAARSLSYRQRRSGSQRKGRKPWRWIWGEIALIDILYWQNARNIRKKYPRDYKGTAELLLIMYVTHFRHY